MEPDISDTELRAIIDEANRKAQGDAATGEVFPGNTVAAVANSPGGAPCPFPMKWGYERPGSSLIINARSETAALKPMFRGSMELRRCLISATHYFEWQRHDGGKTKYAIRPEGVHILYMAGLYRLGRDSKMASCVILTRPASESVSAIHDRMPVILPRDALFAWLSPDGRPAEVLDAALEQMHAEAAAG